MLRPVHNRGFDLHFDSLTCDIRHKRQPKDIKRGKDGFVDNDSRVLVADAFGLGILFDPRRFYLSFAHHRTCRGAYLC